MENINVNFTGKGDKMKSKVGIVLVNYNGLKYQNSRFQPLHTVPYKEVCRK